MLWPENGGEQINSNASDSANGQLYYSVVATSSNLTLFATVNFANGSDDSFHYKLDGKDSGWSTKNNAVTSGYQELEIKSWSGLNVGQTYTLKIQRREDGARFDSFRVSGGEF